MRQLELIGSPYEIGRQFGTETKGDIATFIQCICNTQRFKLTQAELDSGSRKIERLDRFLNLQYQEVATELKGTADASGVSYEETLWYNSYEELFYDELTTSYRCSNIAFLAGPDGPLLGKTNDIEYYLLPYFRMMSIRPASGYRVLQIGTVGTFMTNAGINSEGLAYGGTGLFTKSAFQDGLPHTFLQRLTLQNCRNVREAVEYVRESQLMRIGMHMSLVDAEGNGAIVGKMPDGLYVVHPDAHGAMYCTNHILDDRFAGRGEDFLTLFANSRRRYETLERLSDPPRKDLAAVQRILRNHDAGGAVCQHGQDSLFTVLAYVLQPGLGKFHLSEGYPCLNRFQEYGIG